MVLQRIRGSRGRVSGIARIGVGDPPTSRSREVPKRRYVYGCLTDEDVYAVDDATIAMVQGPR